MKIFIEGGGFHYTTMFIGRGYEVVPDLEQAELVCFTGGADVNPSYYGEQPHPQTHFSAIRDEDCFKIFNHCIKNDVPMVGICRGAQFLCVANGGSLWQHVDNHAIHGSHKAQDVLQGYELNVTSTHHQMMRPEGVEGIDFEVLLTANMSFRKEKVVDGTPVGMLSSTPDVEACMWQATKSLGFQPHPEFPSAPEACTAWFFEKLDLILE